MKLQLEAIQEDVISISKKAGTKLKDYFGKPIAKSSKSTPFDIVTEADKAVEEIISGFLLERYPDFRLIGEEGGGMGTSASEAEYFWFVDPLDGTTNFANKLPIFATSIALTDANYRPLLGAVYAPIQDELYTSIDGGKSYLNGNEITVSEKTDLMDCVLGSGFPYSKYTDPNNNITQWSYFLTRTRGLRRYGSAALDLCYVADGRLDAYWEMKLYPWDYLAGAIIVRNAGGYVTDFFGNETTSVESAKGHIVASNPHIHDAIIKGLSETNIQVD